MYTFTFWANSIKGLNYDVTVQSDTYIHARHRVQKLLTRQEPIMMHPNKMYVVLALNTGKNVSQEQLVLSKILQMSVVRLIGCYKGETENSYLCEATKKANLDVFIEIGDLYHQESILILGTELVDGTRMATLHYIGTNEDEHIGFWRNIGAQKPSAESYTFDPKTKNYYICEKNGCKLFGAKTLL